MSEDAPSCKLSILIANWNVRDYLRECLHAIHEQLRVPRDDYEIVVVDNASTDGSVEMLREEFPDVVLLRNDRNVGFGRANNQALAASRGRYLLILNTDAVILDDSVDRMLAYLEEHEDVGAVGARLQNPDGSYQHGGTCGSFMNLANVACDVLWLDRLLPPKLRPRPVFYRDDPQGTFDVDWVNAACMLVRREAVPEPFFDPRFFLYAEDMDLCYRMRRNGWRVVYMSSASVKHYGSQSTGQSPLFELNLLNGIRTYLLLRHGRVKLVLYDALFVTSFGLRWIGFLAAGLLRPGRGYLKVASQRRKWFGFALRLMLGMRTPEPQS